MKRFLALLVLLISSTLLSGGNTLRFTTPSFSFLITEPEGWMVDHRSAAQVAHLVLHEKGQAWRTARLVIYARFVPNSRDESPEDFLKADEQKFLEQCPFAEISDVDMEIGGFQQYLVKSYECPGIQTEVVAVTSLSSDFALFVLSSQRGSDISAGMGPFKEVLETFRWVPTPPRKLPMPEPTPPDP
jgi:hypothetical protein